MAAGFLLVLNGEAARLTVPLTITSLQWRGWNADSGFTPSTWGSSNSTEVKARTGVDPAHARQAKWPCGALLLIRLSKPLQEDDRKVL